MSTIEGPLADHEQWEQIAAEAMFHQDGSLNEAYLSEHYGLGADEGIQVVAWGKHTGTVAQMFDDENCPVGGRMRTAYQEKGLDGVIEGFEDLKKWVPGLSVKISETTIQRERVKKKKMSRSLTD